ncbi:uncharacterized protein EV420DRAFT_634491 [Desarmillaria tabescens]|uniref:TPR-like protein n=1 Tax=Armillaria tabescens TaxID=1929756 RepID=A0AA39K1W9_ARMTA|nr:uncharacterized protein EV420DRAFT_634491 [Desarmillaria tabescens]KAK0452995.1 hypothetical protein EV420DRAFT_634491 [Desarmillaria tabescens]
MSTPKDKYYWTQLRAALTSGQWSSSYPSKAPNGTSLSWSELFRKFNKHCKGYEDVTEVASQTHALALLLVASSKDDDQDDAPRTGDYALELGDESVLPEEQKGEAQAGYNILKKLESSNFDTLNFALAYYAYALGNPTECLSHLNKVPDVVHIQNHIPLPETLHASSSTLRVPKTITAIVESSISSAGASIITDASVSIPEIKDGRAWALTETLRSLCLQGMSYEKLFPENSKRALASYSAAIPLLNIVESEITSAVAPTSTGKLDFTSFTRFRELWRWVERLIWRAVILSSWTSNVRDKGASLWTWLNHYSSCSASWPSNFRTAHRSAISVLYLRALIIRYGHDPSITPRAKQPVWLPTARSLVQEYRAILSVSTKFPRAGERNTKVEEFVDLCVGIWEASGAVGESTSWVLDVLWWATRMTFNSFRILRHMMRVLRVSGDINLAKRTLRLYVQVVGKAWQTSDAGVGADTDTDQNWVETLVYGIRMLCNLASMANGIEGIEDVREAETLVEKAKTRLDENNQALVASLLLAEGVCQSVMALKQQDPHSRSQRLVTAHALLIRSSQTFPTASAYYHLALSFARSGELQDLQQAIVNAGLAVEGDPREVRYWHLLGLLSAATEEWEPAQMALESGAAIGEEEVSVVNGPCPPEASQMDPDNELLGVPSPTTVNGNGRVIDGLPHTDDDRHPALNGTKEAPEVKPVYLLGKDDHDIPSASNLLQPVQDHPSPSRQELFEDSLQLRMTQFALTEVVEGAEGASQMLPEIFVWIADRMGHSVTDTARSSLDGGRSTMQLKSPSELILSPTVTNPETLDQTSEEKRRLSIPHSGSTEPPAPPIPITISPATPDGQSQDPEYVQSMALHDEKAAKRSEDHERDASKSKKVQKMLKNRVHKSGARISNISKKIGSGVVRNGSLLRSNSAPDFHAVLRQTAYQASSIHSRRRLSLLIRSSDSVPNESPPPPPTPALPQQTTSNKRTAREMRLLSDLWLMSAATFRRLGKIEQARGAIQEAEVRDENNPAVWVQLGLYYIALGQSQDAIDAFQKALFISPDNVPAAVHLCRLYLSGEAPSCPTMSDYIDLAVGMLSRLAKGPGWDVPEVWYFLGKAYGAQSQRERERECLGRALTLSERRGVREISAALGWCL